MARRGNRRAGALVYVTLALPVMLGFCSLAVDVGRVQVVKMQLRRAADAAARYAAYGMAFSVATAQSNAVASGAENTADGTPIVIDPNLDVELGTWTSSTHTFTPSSGNSRNFANAVRVTVRRTAARGNAVPLLFGQAIGRGTCDVTASAVATWYPGGYGVFGTRSISLSGNSFTSYWSSSGTSANAHGSIATNGSITIGGSAQVDGDAHPGPFGSVSNPSAVTGNTTPMTSMLFYPPASAGSYATTNDNGNIPGSFYNSATGDFSVGSNKSATLPGGHYYFNNFSVGSKANLTFTGPTTLYVYGSLSLTGQSVTSSNVPGNLTINVVSSGFSSPASVSIDVKGGASLYANIYAPLSDINLTGNGDIYGSLIGNNISASGNAAIHYDMSLGGYGTVALVQ